LGADTVRWLGEADGAVRMLSNQVDLASAAEALESGRLFSAQLWLRAY
jgi:hypothetical protein